LIKAVFICAAGDGEVSKTERDYFFGYLDAVGMCFDPFQIFFFGYPPFHAESELLFTSSGT
jgi:hypothetical protein